MEVSYPSLSSATSSGAPGPGGVPTAIIASGTVVGFLPSNISYTGKCTAGTCQTVSSAPANQITFTYEVRPDTMTTAMVGGQQVIVTRLKAIQSMSNGSAVRTYQLAYSTSPLGSSLLSSIAMVGSDGVTTLSTTTFSYQSNPNYSVALSTAYQLPVDITKAALVDVDEDGLPDLVQNYSGVGSGAWLNTGAGWAADNTWIPPVALLSSTGGDEGVRFADIDGDGLTDIIKGKFTTQQAWLNTGSGWSVASSSWNPPVNFVDNNALTEGSVIYDVNADGFPDILQHVDYEYTWPARDFSVTGNWLNNGSGWGPKISTWVPPGGLYKVSYDLFAYCYACQYDYGVRFADLDGDGLVDILTGYLNNGKGWSQKNQWASPVPFVAYYGFFPGDTGLRIVDINSDGLADLVRYSSAPLVNIWLNTGHGWLQNDSFAPTISSIATAGYLEYADLNGDNVADIIALSTNPASQRVYLGRATPANVLTSVINDLGGATQISYAFSPPPVQAGMHLPPVTVVQSITKSGGISGSVPVSSSYAFAGGRFDNSWPNREFLGFGEVEVTDGLGNSTITEFLQDENSVNGVNLYKGMISETAQFDRLGNLLSHSTYTVSYSTPFPGVYFPFTSETDSYLDSKGVAVQHVYDSYGNLTREINLGDIGTAGDERTSVTTYSASTGPYLMSYPIAKYVYSGVGTTGSLLSRTSFYYEPSYTQSPTQGILTKTVSMLSGGQNPVVISSHDVYGNVTDSYDALYNATSGAQGNHIRITYETTFNQYPQSKQQGVGSSLNWPAENFTYDSGTGQISRRLDINGSTTTYSYDIFGRLKSVVGPADQATPSSPTLTYQYNLNTAPPHSIVSNSRVAHGSTITLATYTFFDGLGRQIETKTAAPGGKQVISGAISFNSLGQAATSYVSIVQTASSDYVAPLSTQPHSVTTYDGLGRVVRVVNPDNTVSTRAYQGWTETATDENGHSKISVKNAYGQVVQVQENFNGSTFVTGYDYDLLGNLTNILNSLGQPSTISYDTLSRKTGLVDPQMGTWSYEYDPNGNLIEQTDSKNQTITMTYDAVSRRTFKIFPDATTISYSYDSGSFARGRLTGTIDLSGTQGLSYDSEGNVLSKTRTIGGAVYVTSRTYDAMGREVNVTYPDSVQLNSVYDASLLSSVQAANGSFVYASLGYSTTAVGKIGTVAYGNGMSSQYSYSSSTLRISNLRTQAGAGTIQNLSYTYDNVGNIASIADAVGTMTQSFSYDPLDRLSQAVGPYGTSRYAYDSIGNLTLNSDNSAGFWGFPDNTGITTLQGSVLSTSSRVGNGLSFNGSSLASINDSSAASPPAAITISLWIRPSALGGEYAVAKSTSYYFPKVASNGSIEAKLQLSSGEQIVNVSSAPLRNLWSYVVMTYDGSAIKIYVNGRLWKSQSASGTIQTSTQSIVLGSSFTGQIDELSVYPRALSAGEILQRYQLYPSLALSQPFTPSSVPAGMTSGLTNTVYTFNFTGWDLNGNSIKYRIDWDTGTLLDTSYFPSGTTYQSTFSWANPGTYDVRLQSVRLSSTGAEVASAWSPTLGIFITSTSIQSALEFPFLMGASANVATLAARISTGTVGESATGRSTSSGTIGYLGYQGATVAPSSWTAQYLGQQGLGGADAPPTPEIPASNLVNIQFSTSSVDISTIALNLLQHGSASFVDANGNLLVGNGRWITYDFENRPTRIVTQDATLIQFDYDFEGNRTRQTITPLSQSSQTTVYVGGIYEKSSTATIKYISAGALRVATLDSTGATTYFLPDHLGSTNLLVNSSLSTVRNTRYMPFGGTFQTSGTVDDAHKFTGQRLDGSSGLYYYGARYYDPLSGRFIMPDSVIQDNYDPQALNRYAYCRNNPLKLVDSDGHVFFIPPAVMAWTLLGSAAAGGAAAYQFGGHNLDAIGPGMARGVIMGGTFLAAAAVAPVATAGAVAVSVGTALSGGNTADIATNAVLAELMPAVAGVGASLGAGLRALGSSTLGTSASNPMTGYTWNQVFQARYGAGNVEWMAPKLPSEPLTRGVLRTGAGDFELASGWHGYSALLPRGSPGFDIVTRTHVEGQAAALMAKQKIFEGSLYMNNPVMCISCSRNLPFMLGPDRKLDVFPFPGYGNRPFY